LYKTARQREVRGKGDGLVAAAGETTALRPGFFFGGESNELGSVWGLPGGESV
jgi:hypothetical protein